LTKKGLVSVFVMRPTIGLSPPELPPELLPELPPQPARASAAAAERLRSAVVRREEDQVRFMGDPFVFFDR